jgi:hypothetical protein
VALAQVVESTAGVDSGETCGDGVWGKCVVVPLLRADSHDKNVIVRSTTHPVSKSIDGNGYYCHHRICRRSRGDRAFVTTFFSSFFSSFLKNLKKKNPFSLRFDHMLQPLWIVR